MRSCIGLLILLVLIAPGGAQDEARQKYHIDKSRIKISGPRKRDRDGKLVWDVTFDEDETHKAIRLVDPKAAPADGEMLVFMEKGKEAYRMPLQKEKSEALTAVLALDVSGSMRRPSKTGKTKMDEARAAARVFLGQLHPKADLGLILFDHRIKSKTPPAGRPEQVAAHRQTIATQIAAAQPDGGTAYLDAAYDALEMLRNVKEGQRAVVLVTDGRDQDSKKKLADVVRLSTELQIPVYTIGIGDSGWNEPVSTVLVLDHSASMAARAGRNSKTKMVAAQEAASRFVDLMRPGARATVLPFSSKVERPDAFTDNPVRLKDHILALSPEGGTSLYDGTLAGVRTVSAGATRPKERRCVVVLTDGIDEEPGSRHRPKDVWELAKEEQVTVFMLGLGDKDEINKDVMKEMAEKTGGKFFHAENQQELYAMFEELSLDIHGDGIDEKALRDLSQQTKGHFYRAEDASELTVLYKELAEKLKPLPRITFPSVNQSFDGDVSDIDYFIVDVNGQSSNVVMEDKARPGLISNVVQEDKARPGLIKPEFDYLVYLVVLVLLVGLAMLPAVLRRGAVG